MESLLIKILLGIAAAWFAAIEFRIKKNSDKLDHNLTESQIRNLIEDKLKSYSVELAEIKKDIETINLKIDKLISLYIDDQTRKK
jgi:hypothetical protein